MTKLQRAVEHTALSKRHESRRHGGSGIDPTQPDQPRPSPFLIQRGLRLYQSAETFTPYPPPPTSTYALQEPGKTFPAAINFSCALRRWRKSGKLLSFSPCLISPTHAKVTHWNKIAKRFCYIQHSMFCWGIKQLSVKGKKGERWVCGGSIKYINDSTTTGSSCNVHVKKSLLSENEDYMLLILMNLIMHLILLLFWSSHL